MHIQNSEGHEHTMLGQKCAFATASLILGIASFIGLLGFEKAVLAIAFGWLALRSLPGSEPILRRGWARAGIVLGILQVVLLVGILVLGRHEIRRMVELLSARSAAPIVGSVGTAPAAVDTAIVGKHQPEAARPAIVTNRQSGLVPSNQETKRFNWRQLESEDYRKYVANLRAIGCPEQTVRDIILADVNELFRQRARAQQSATNRFEYWKGGNPIANLMTPEKVAQRQDLSRQKRELLGTLLGDTSSTEPEAAGVMDHMIEALDILPSDKVSLLVEMEERYQARVLGVMKEASQGDIAGLKQILAEHDAETLRILTPEERFDYEVRLSPTAMRLRMQMGDFEATEEEFRRIFELQRAFDDQYSPLGIPSRRPEDQPARETAQLELNRQIEAVLGTARYQEYQQKKTPAQ